MDLSAGCGEAARLAGRRERINDVIAIDERLGADVAIAESLCRWRAAVDNLNFCPRALISVPTLTSLIDSPVQGATLIGNTEITLAEVWGRGPSYMHAFSRYFPHHFGVRLAIGGQLPKKTLQQLAGPTHDDCDGFGRFRWPSAADVPLIVPPTALLAACWLSCTAIFASAA